jgi:protein-L-isoaspartate(D-aspartate) O-methyltransferase
MGMQMTDFAASRRQMVDCQVRTCDVTDPRLIAALQELPRERFVPGSLASVAYFDGDLPVGEAKDGHSPRCLLKPLVLAKLIQAAEISVGDHVLDIGCTTGYAAAVLARLAGSVVALDESPELLRRARSNLAELGIGNVTVVEGPLKNGWSAAAPYDAIIFNGATEIVPVDLARQLKDGGRLACVLGSAPGKAMLYRKVGGDLSGRSVFDAAAPVLPGFAATPEFVF